MAVPVDPERVEELTSEERRRFEELHPRSLELARRSVEVMPAAVPTAVCGVSPFPVAVASGSGAGVIDVDANEYVDYANGFGVSIFGHANLQITAAIKERAARGVHFGALSREVAEWAQTLASRYRLDWVRFSNSGTEATMDAVRLARALTNRTIVVKVEGAYHGSHEIALVSGNQGLGDDAGPDDAPSPRLWSDGVSARVLGEVRAIPFNNLAAAERELADGAVACVITEPILFNVGAIFPEPGYLEGLREICDRHGTLLIFDETKTAMTVAHGGAEELLGARPHIKTLGKGIGGGLACGAFGCADERGYEEIARGDVPHLGTFSGNPLTASAGAAALAVMDEDAYDDLRRHAAYLRTGLEEVIGEYELPAYVVSAAAKGCVVWADPAAGELRDYRDYARRFDFALGNLAWLWLMNRGVWLAPGQDEQTTHSIAHTEADADAYIAGLRDLAQALRS